MSTGKTRQAWEPITITTSGGALDTTPAYMSGRGGPRSIWKKHSKPQGEVKREEGDKLYYRINRRTGRIETNLLEWERSWRNVKILKFPARYAEELRRGVRVNPTIEQILEANVMLPDVDTTREYWIPTPE